MEGASGSLLRKGNFFIDSRWLVFFWSLIFSPGKQNEPWQPARLTTSKKNLPLFPESELPESIDVLHYESLARDAGYLTIAGVDEAGRGPLAGPVVAAAVILPAGLKIDGVKDSKKMTESAREKSFFQIQENAIAVSIGVVPHGYIDQFNILKASLEAMRLAVVNLDPKPQFLLVDGNQAIPVAIPHRCVVKGDSLSLSISAASVVAKVYRDRIMRSYHGTFPWYRFAQNKGYATGFHYAALRAHGACPVHRRSFKGVC
jgi:ribonuclease HII